MAPPADPAGLGQPAQRTGQQQAPKPIDANDQQPMQAQRACLGGKGIQELGDGALAGDEVGMEQIAP